MKIFPNFCRFESVLVMRKFFSTSLYRKLLLGFIVVGVLPFGILYLYLIFYGEQKITQNILKTEYTRLKIQASTIDKVLHTLQKELLFLSRLDMIDDVISEDVDKRLARILMQKKQDIGGDMEFVIVDPQMKVVTSSAVKELKGEYRYKKELEEALRSKKDFFLEKNRLFFLTPLFASFDKSKRIGTMILEYGLQNLKEYLPNQNGKSNFLVQPKTDIVIGYANHPSLYLQETKGYVRKPDSLIVYRSLDSRFLPGWYYVSMIEKSKAFAFLNDFLYFMSIIFPVGILLVFAVAFVSAKRVIQPLKQLTKGVEKITKTKNYKQHIRLDAEDEIGTLAKAFNTLLDTTSEALEQLEAENKMRLKRFIQLIEIFNTIIQTKTEEECVETSIKEIEKLTGEDIIHFEMTKQEGVPILVTDFEQDKKVHYGTIVLEKEKLSPSEWRFYNSIAIMIALQLDRIRLIAKTEAASRAKSAFISNMSHELRTPLNAIIGFTQYLIAYEELTEEQREIIGNIESSASYLLEMINDILDIAKIEAGKMEAHIEEFELGVLLEEITTMLKHLTEQKGLELHFSKPKERIVMHNDSKFVKQIIVNLLSNAIKFTKEGYIQLDVKQKESKVEIVIHDTGIGIDSKDLKRLFSDFTQLENTMQKKHKGTGLGLSLSKKLAYLLGGDIRLNSEGIGKGSTAIVTLPINYDTQS